MALSQAKRAAARAEVQSQSALPRFLTVVELAARIARNEFTIYHQARREPERLPRVTRIGGRVLFDERDVLAWFDAQRGDVSPLPAVQNVEAPRRRGRPTKAEQIARRAQQSAGVHQ